MILKRKKKNADDVINRGGVSEQSAELFEAKLKDFERLPAGLQIVTPAPIQSYEEFSGKRCARKFDKI